VVLVGGLWKTGKTDFALFIAETLLKLNLVVEVASNIDTQETYPMISDLISLRHWLHGTNRRKLYILDEANVHLFRRRAMSAKNVGVIQLLGEVSKAHARLIIIAQELLSVDKEFLNPTWVRGVFIKKSLKKAQLVSHMIPRSFTFNNVPPTTVTFDPYTVAPFQEAPAPETLFKEENLQKVYAWATGTSYSELGFDHPMKFNRFLRTNVRRILDKLQKL
jgi:hypothetical protein